MSSNTAVGLVLVFVLIAAFSFVVYKKMSAQQTDPAQIKLADTDDDDPHADDDPFNTADEPFRADDETARHDPRGIRSVGNGHHDRQPFGADDTGGRTAADSRRLQHAHAAGQSRTRPRDDDAFGSTANGQSSPFSEFEDSEPTKKKQQTTESGFDFEEFAQSTSQAPARHGHPHDHSRKTRGAFDPFSDGQTAQQASAAQTAGGSQASDDAFDQNNDVWQDDDETEAPPPPQQFAADDFFDDQSGDAQVEPQQDAGGPPFGAFDDLDTPQQADFNWDEPPDESDGGSFGDDAFGHETGDTSDPPEHQPIQQDAEVWGQVPNQFDDESAREAPQNFKRPPHRHNGRRADWPAGHDSFGRDDADSSGTAWPPGSEDPFIHSEPGSGHRPADGSRHGVYVIEKQDNYWGISKKLYGTPRYYMALLKFNQERIPDPTKMRPGMKLITPSAEYLEAHYQDILPNAARQVGGTDVHSGSNSDLPAGFFWNERGRPMYRVGRHDTLSSVAHRHLGRASRWIQIYALNRKSLPTPHDLPVGTELILPRDASQVQLVQNPHETR